MNHQLYRKLSKIRKFIREKHSQTSDCTQNMKLPLKMISLENSCIVIFPYEKYNFQNKTNIILHSDKKYSTMLKKSLLTHKSSIFKF